MVEDLLKSEVDRNVQQLLLRDFQQLSLRDFLGNFV